MNDRVTGERRAHREFPRKLWNVREARAWTTQTLLGWGLHSSVDAAVLIVSELFTNAAMYGMEPIHVNIEREADSLRVEVRDSGSTMQSLSAVGRPGNDADGELGFRVVGALSSAWGVDATDDGTAIWARIHLRPPL